MFSTENVAKIIELICSKFWLQINLDHRGHRLILINNRHCNFQGHHFYIKIFVNLLSKTFSFFYFKSTQILRVQSIRQLSNSKKMFFTKRNDPWKKIWIEWLYNLVCTRKTTVRRWKNKLFERVNIFFVNIFFC